MVLNKYNIHNKHLMSYEEWLQRYKGKQIDEVMLDDHKTYLSQFKSWQIGNIERV